MKAAWFFFLTLKSMLAVQCNYNLTPFSFGAYDPANKNPTNSSAVLSIVCDGDQPLSYVVTCNAGLGLNANVLTGRLLTHPSKSTLRYNLYTDQFYINILGDGVSGNSIEGVTTNAEPGKNNVNVPIFGRISPLQDAPSGAYSDTLTITIVMDQVN